MDKLGTRSFSDGGCYTPQYSAHPCESNVVFVLGIAAARKVDLWFFFASSTAAPTETVSFADTTAARADGGRDGIDENKDEYANCTYDIREYFQPPLPLIFPIVEVNDDADE